MTCLAELPSRDTGFHEAFLWDLMTHPNEWRHPHHAAPNALSTERNRLAGKVRDLAERRGFVIESGPDGYRLVGYRWVPLRTGPVPGEGLGMVPVQHCDGQLSLVGGGDG